MLHRQVAIRAMSRVLYTAAYHTPQHRLNPPKSAMASLFQTFQESDRGQRKWHMSRSFRHCVFSNFLLALLSRVSCCTAIMQHGAQRSNMLHPLLHLLTHIRAICRFLPPCFWTRRTSHKAATWLKTNVWAYQTMLPATLETLSWRSTPPIPPPATFCLP